MPSAFNGLVVLDFSHALAGPYCTLLLAQQGASVYKIEQPGSGDMGRGWGPPFQGGEACYFLGLNYGKKSVALDLKHKDERDLCLQLIERADVLVENFRPGAMHRVGLDYESLAARNPRLVYCSISGYGQNGPSREEPAMDLILQASSGLISVTGTESGETVRCGHSVADITAGMMAAFAIATALYAREKSGRGQYIDISMLDSMISAMASNYANFFGTGNLPRPLGTAFYSIVPYRTFAAADREVATAVGSEKLWAAFCRAIRRPDLANHPDYRDNGKRVENRHLLEPLLADIFRGATAEEWRQRLSAEGVPCAPVRNLSEVAADPQTAVREMFPALVHPTADAVRVTGTAAKLSDADRPAPTPAPRLGEHTREAFRDLLGLPETELDRLERTGAIR